MEKDKTGKDGSKKTPTLKRWEALQGYSVALPGEETLPAALSAALAGTDRTPAEPPAAIPIDYPLLRTRLRDQGLAFQAKYNQGETAQILGVSDRTVRDWTNAGKMRCCRSPLGRPYYTAQNIEDHLTECESPSKEVK